MLPSEPVVISHPLLVAATVFWWAVALSLLLFSLGQPAAAAVCSAPQAKKLVDNSGAPTIEGLKMQVGACSGAKAGCAGSWQL
jgi:hypothetical protein